MELTSAIISIRMSGFGIITATPDLPKIGRAILKNRGDSETKNAANAHPQTPVQDLACAVILLTLASQTVDKPKPLKGILKKAGNEKNQGVKKVHFQTGTTATSQTFYVKTHYDTPSQIKTECIAPQSAYLTTKCYPESKSPVLRFDLTKAPTKKNVRLLVSEPIVHAHQSALDHHAELMKEPPFEYATSMPQFDLDRETAYLLTLKLNRAGESITEKRRKRIAYEIEAEMDLICAIIESKRFTHINLFDLLDAIESIFHEEDPERYITKSEAKELTDFIATL